MLYSPNGEPLNGGPLGRPTCQEALSGWFDEVDLNHDGVISRAEFMADARTQLNHMDIDQNGYLVSEELERYRLPYRQQEPVRAVAASDQSSDAGQAGGSRRHGRGLGGGYSSGGSGLPGATDEADPVMSADTNNDFRVTPAEFMAQAAVKFAALGQAHAGRLTREDVLTLCGRVR